MTDTSVAYNLNNAKHLVENNHFIGNVYLGATTRTISSDPSVGTMAFDSTTKKPIWWNGSAWVDATGTNVYHKNISFAPQKRRLFIKILYYLLVQLVQHLV
jgi:hypothetical protein